MYDYSSFRDFLYRSLRERSKPVFLLGERICPAASVWSGMRLVVEKIKNSQLSKKNLIVIEATHDIPFLESIFALMWSGIPFAIIPANVPHGISTPRHNAKLADGNLEVFSLNAHYGNSLPPDSVFMRSSGTAGEPKWICLTEKNIMSVVNSHLNSLEIKNAHVLSVLPWYHTFGLVLELLTSVATADIIIRPDQPGNTKTLIQIGNSADCNFMNAVPVMIERMIKHNSGRDFLHSLKDGIVGGAEITDPDIISFLKKTNLRPGYGQTEASPGIMLGNRGEWEPLLTGRPIGCTVKIHNGELYFSGNNVCAGRIKNDLFEKSADFMPTGDQFVKSGEKYYFQGRKSDNFKLSNGTFLEVRKLEFEVQKSTGETVIIRKSVQKSGRFDILILHSEATFDDTEEHLIKDKIIASIPTNLLNYLDQTIFICDSEVSRTAKGSINRIEMETISNEL